MNSISGITTLFFTILVSLFWCTRAHIKKDPQYSNKYEPSEFTSSVNRFSFNFYKAAAAGLVSNSVMSPLSADVALSLLSLGALDDTFKELKTTLDLTDSYKTSYKNFVEKLKPFGNETVKIANKIYVAKNYLLNEAVKRDAVDLFNSEIQNIDFTGNTTADEINQWVETHTNHAIKKLVSPSSIDSTTKMALVNAIYFKGNWEYQFDINATKMEDFFLNSQMSIKVDMMHQQARGKYGHVAEWDAETLELFYKDSVMSLVIILPNKIWGLTDLERKLTNHQEVLSKISQANTVMLDVALPKFKIETTLNLKTILPKMGINKIFESASAQLQGMFEGKTKHSEPTYVGAAIQKAFIDVNEQGTEASASTYLTSNRFGEEEMYNFVANHPFVFLLKQYDDIILFMVLVPKPVSWPVVSFRAEHPFMFFIVDYQKHIIFSGKFTGKK